MGTMASDFPKRITSGWIATATPMDCNLPRLQKTHPQVIWEKTLSGSDWIHAINIMAEFTNSPPPFRYLRLQKKAALIFIGKTGMDVFFSARKNLTCKQVRRNLDAFAYSAKLATTEASNPHESVLTPLVVERLQLPWCFVSSPLSLV